jgi:glycosyltransferase involved in cell wall biosynthesis
MNSSIKRPAISVVIPAFNEEKYLPFCLASLKKQTFKDFEIIVVDNNSTDNTAPIAKQFGARIVSEKRQGIGFTRARGISCALGEIIAVTEADTIVPPNWLKTISQNFSLFPADIVGISGPLDCQHRLIPDFVIRFFCCLVFDKLARLLTGHILFVGPNMALKKSAWEKIKTCQGVKFAFDEFDISCHLKEIGELRYISSLYTSLSLRRIGEDPLKGLSQYLAEYPIRFVQTIFLHHPWFLRHKKSP